MPSYNIFRVDEEHIDQMMQKFDAAGLNPTFDDTIENCRYRFFFSNRPIDAQISWLELYKHFIDPEKEPKNKSYFAVLLITLETGVVYAISLGKAHFYLQAVCEYDFGLRLAERIFSKAKLKHGKHFSSRRNKTIVSYYRNNLPFYESGEAIGLIKGDTVDSQTWGRTVTFGQSIKLCVDYSPEELHNLLYVIENKLAEEPIIKLPRAYAVTENIKILELNSIISQKLLSGKVPIDMDEFQCNTVYFSFTDEYDGFRLRISVMNGDTRYVKESQILNDLSSEAVQSFLISVVEDGIQLADHINDVKVKLLKAGSKPETIPLVDMLEIVTDDWYCILNGRWMRFSQEYVVFLKDQVNNVRRDIDTPIILKKYRKVDRELRGLGNEGEDTLIERVASEHQYTITHKSHSNDMMTDSYNVEVADMKSSDTLYYVKLGNTQALCYLIDQATTVLTLLRNQRLRNDPNTAGVRFICLWMIFDERVNDLATLSDINSITLLIALGDWITAVHDAGFEPVVNIGYRRVQTI